MNNSLKVGIDFHGVIDTFPEKFKQLLELWRSERKKLGIVLPEDL